MPAMLRREHREILQMAGAALRGKHHFLLGDSATRPKRSLHLDRPVFDWLSSVLARQDVEVLPLTRGIVVDATSLREPFHRDPADQLIVATARVLSIRC